MMCLAWRGCGGWVVAAYVLAAAGVARAQETCATATAIAIGSPFLGNNAAATSDGPSGLCGVTARDVWHSFAPTVTGIHTISLCGSSFDTVATVYDACGGNEVGCNDDACGQQSQVVVSLVAGQTYILRVAASAATGGAGGAYRVTITPPPAAPPAGNACGSGQVLPPNQPINGNNAGASGNDITGTCGGSLDRADVWYSYNPSASGLHIVELCTTAFDGVLSVHSSCFNSQLLGCSDDDAVTGCAPGSGSRVSFNGVAGTPVLIRVAGADGGFGPFSLAIRTAAANDQCGSATPITRGFTYSGAVTPALSTDGSASCAASAFDVWHTHLATVTGPHTISLCGSTFDSVISVFRGCPGTSGSVQIGCSDDGCPSGGGVSELVQQLEVGELYHIRVAGKTTAGQTSTGNYSIRIDLTAPTNDACAAAAPLTLGVPVNAITNGATGSDITSCGANDARDVWYAFTPASGGVYEFNTCGSVVNTTLGLFSSCSTEIACSDDEPSFCGATQANGSRITRVLSAGVTYLVRVAANSAVDAPFRLVVNQAPPSNDDCGLARVLTAGVVVGGTFSGATPSGFATCAGGDNPDVYFSFNPAQTGHYRITTCGSAAKTTLSIYSVCPPATEVFCSNIGDTSCGSGQSTDLTAVLQAGATYRIRVSAESGASASPFLLAVMAVTPPNDDCLRAEPLVLNSFVPASSVGAAGIGSSGCGAGDEKDVWFHFVPELPGTYEFLTCAASGPGVGQVDTTLALFDACGGTELACNDNAAGSCGGSPMLSRVTARLDLGHDYVVRAAVAGGGEGTFYVGVRYARPANDTCAAAATIADGLTRFDNLGADTDMVSGVGCGLGFSMVFNDVWFRYVAPMDGSVVVSTCGSSFDTAILVMDGTTGCGPDRPVVSCDNDYDCDGVPATPDSASRAVFLATAGRPYLLRIGSVSGERGSGEVRISRPNAPICRCDWNGQSGVTVQDVFDFLVDWFDGRGDFNLDGLSELGDLFDFLTCYFLIPVECR